MWKKTAVAALILSTEAFLTISGNSPTRQSLSLIHISCAVYGVYPGVVGAFKGEKQFFYKVL